MPIFRNPQVTKWAWDGLFFLNYISLRQWALHPPVCPAHESEDFFDCETFLCWAASVNPKFFFEKHEFILALDRVTISLDASGF